MNYSFVAKEKIHLDEINAYFLGGYNVFVLLENNVTFMLVEISHS